MFSRQKREHGRKLQHPAADYGFHNARAEASRTQRNRVAALQAQTMQSRIILSKPAVAAADEVMIA
jgi:hypothetical protein